MGDHCVMLLVCYSSMLVWSSEWRGCEENMFCVLVASCPDRMWVILRRQSPLPVNHPIGQQETKDELTKQEGVGERRAPFGQHFGQRFPDEQCLFRSVQCRCRSGWVEAKWVRLASALITCTVTSPGQHFLAPTPRQQKAKTATTFVTRGEYFLQCHAFSPAQTCIFGGLLWSKLAIVGHRGGATCFGCKFWPQSGTTCISQKFGHTLAPLALA